MDQDRGREGAGVGSTLYSSMITSNLSSGIKLFYSISWLHKIPISQRRFLHTKHGLSDQATAEINTPLSVPESSALSIANTRGQPSLIVTISQPSYQNHLSKTQLSRAKYLHQPRGFLCNFHVWRLQVYDNVGALFQELLLMNYQEQTIKFGEFTRFLTQFGVQYVIKVANFPDKWALILQKTKLHLYP